MLTHYNYKKSSDVVYLTYNNQIIDKALNKNNFDTKDNFDVYRKIDLGHSKHTHK